VSSKNSLIKQIINDPNSSFCGDDAKHLTRIPEDVLQRMVSGLGSKTVPVHNEARLHELQEGLSDCQKDIVELVGIEKKLRDALETEFDVEEVSVLNRFLPQVAVANVAKSGPVTEKDVQEFIETSTTPTAAILREGKAARDMMRQESIDVIVTNCNGAWTESDLRRMPTPDLKKWASLMSNQKSRVSMNEWNFEGAGMADRAVFNSGAYQMGAPLELPSTNPSNGMNQNYY